MTSHLVQILLPVADNAGIPFPDDVLHDIQAELTDKFGGVTAYSRAPAKGVWRHRGKQQTDDIAVVEVMTVSLDVDWWRRLRKRLETLLRQETVVIRAQEIRSL